MLVRLNQIDPRSAEGVAGWTTGGYRGAIAHAWPASAFAYQLLVLDQDEAGRTTADDARRAEVRRLLPSVVEAVARPADHLVLRIDGPFGPGLQPAVAAAADAGAYAVNALHRSTADATPPQASVRLLSTTATLADLCGDERLALAAGVRLRAIPLPADNTDAMLAIADPDDERWSALIPTAAAVVSTAADLTAIVLWTGLAAGELRDRLAPRLAVSR